MTEKLSNDGQNFDLIPDNIKRVRENMRAAALKAGVDCESVTLMAVTKTMPARAVNIALESGITTIGENRVQELLQKLPELSPGEKHLHLIGHLQTNKVRQIIDKVEMIQSLDSLRLAEEIDRQAAKIGRVMDVLVEVNIGEEESKSGIAPSQTEEFVLSLAQFSHIKVRGLMTVPPVCENKEGTRPYFAKMRKLFIDIRDKKMDNRTMQILSMGMSSDYEIAIEEGSNLIRVGSAIFGKRKYQEALK